MTGTKHVHFRGRHMHGIPLALPITHTGAVLRITDNLEPQAGAGPRENRDPTDDEGADEAGDELPEEVKIAQQIGEFDEVVVWGHGGTVDEGSDMFVRGVREWIGFAESMHCDEEEEGEEQGSAAKTL